MSCHGCQYKMDVDITHIFGQYVGMCKLTHSEVDFRDGCEKYSKVESVEIEPDGQYKLF